MQPSERFHSIVFDGPGESLDNEAPAVPAYLADLNLDQIIRSITTGREEYELAPLLHTPLRDVSTVRYRQDVSRDLEQRDVREAVEAFAEKMRMMRERLTFVETLRYRYQKESWFLEAVDVYHDAVCSLADQLARLDVRSLGLQAFRAYLVAYASSDRFTSLATDLDRVREGLGSVTYSVHIKGDRISVSAYEGENDYSEEVLEAFAKFEERAGNDYLVKLKSEREMNHIEAHVLTLVARSFPEVFLALDNYYQQRRDFQDDTIVTFDREIQFYVAYLDHVERFTSRRMPFCYPLVSTESKEISAHGAFDLALAGKLFPEGSPVVCNDFSLESPERILVVSGPNQGGKTTFARMFGQLHYLASLGFPVPGRDARLSLPDRLFTHFEREEDVTTLRGKLDDELVRIRDILERATSSSVIVMNESFTSTTLMDALFLGKKVLGRITELQSLCVYVTFVDELASLGTATVSMVSTVDPHDPAVRTFSVVRKPADGLAYAAAIADKYGLTYAALKERVAR